MNDAAYRCAPGGLRALACIRGMSTIAFLVVCFTAAAQSQQTPSGRFSVAQTGCGNCPPNYCENAGDIDRLIREKKAAATAEGYPPRIVALIDKLPRCRACITGQSSEIKIYVRYDQAKYRAKYGSSSDNSGLANRSSRDSPWSRQAEKQARDDMRDGVATEMQIHLGQASCICCKPTMSAAEVDRLGEKNFETREGDPGWPEGRTIDPNAPGILITSTDQLGPDPDDLGEFPGSREDRSAVRDPGHLRLQKARIIHVTCAACQPLADQYNDIARALNSKLDEFAHRHRQYLVVEAALSRARKRQQAVNETVADTARGRETKAKAQTDVQSLEERLKEEAQLERRVQQDIDQLRARLASVRRQIAECEKQCQRQPRTSSTATPATGAVEPGLHVSVAGGPIVTGDDGKHITGTDTLAAIPDDRRDLASDANGGVAGLLFSYYINPAPMAHSPPPILLFLRSGYLRVVGAETRQDVRDINLFPRGTGVVVDPPKWSVPLLFGVSVAASKIGFNVPGLSFEVFGGAQFMRREASFSLTELGAPGGGPIFASASWTSFDPTVGFGFQYRLPNVAGHAVTAGASVMFDWSSSQTLTAQSPNFPSQSYTMQTGRQFDTIVLFSIGVGLGQPSVPGMGR